MTDLQHKVMLVDLSLGVFGGMKTDKRVSKEAARRAGADENDSGKYDKQIISKHALCKIQAAATVARKLHAELTLPWSDGGDRLLNVASYFDYMELMKKARDPFFNEVETFVAAYPRLIEEARPRLGDMWDPADYPTIGGLRERFYFRIITMPLPNTKNWMLELVDEEMSSIRADAESTIDGKMRAAVADVYKRIAEVTGRMTDGLNKFGSVVNEETGKTATFRDSLVENVRGLVATLPNLNITDDPELARITADMQAQLCRVDAPMLRDDAAARAQVAAAAEALKSKADAFLEAFA
jgi:hypothetical protein